MKTKQDLVIEKIVPFSQIKGKVEAWKLKGNKIVFTNGCFDVLHKGHIHLLLQAAELGNQLIVGLNSDSSVKKLKGEDRPVNVQEDRALLLAAQVYVSAVVLFEEDTPQLLIEMIQPDVLVKGGDYTIETVVGSEFVQKYGGEVVLIPTVEGYSSTRTINALKKGDS